MWNLTGGDDLNVEMYEMSTMTAGVSQPAAAFPIQAALPKVLRRVFLAPLRFCPRQFSTEFAGRESGTFREELLIHLLDNQNILERQPVFAP